jgi:hypothetical protein
VAERQDSDREVLTSLPRSRPVRRSAKRGDRADAASATRSARATGTTATKPRAPKPKPKPAPAAKPKSRPKATAPPKRAASRPAPPRKVPSAGYAAPTSRADDAGASGAADLLSTTIQAAAELAQIGLTVGRQTLQSMLDRLPKP